MLYKILLTYCPIKYAFLNKLFLVVTERWTHITFTCTHVVMIRLLSKRQTTEKRQHHQQMLLVEWDIYSYTQACNWFLIYAQKSNSSG